MARLVSVQFSVGFSEVTVEPAAGLLSVIVSALAGGVLNLNDGDHGLHTGSVSEAPVTRSVARTRQV